MKGGLNKMTKTNKEKKLIKKVIVTFNFIDFKQIENRADELGVNPSIYLRIVGKKSLKD